MKYITVEDSIYRITDKSYNELDKLGQRYLENLDYDEALKLLRDLDAKHIGMIHYGFRF